MTSETSAAPEPAPSAGKMAGWKKALQWFAGGLALMLVGLPIIALVAGDNPKIALALAAAVALVAAWRIWKGPGFGGRAFGAMAAFVALVGCAMGFAYLDGTLAEKERADREVAKREAAIEAEAKRQEAAAAQAREAAEADARRKLAEAEAEQKRKQDAEEMQALRKSNPDDYLRRLKERDTYAWQKEVAILRPKEYAAYVEEQKRKSEAEELGRQRKDPTLYLTLDYSWEKGGFDHVMIGTFKIKSDLQFDVRDIEISCVTQGNSGTRLSKASQTIYDVVPAKKTKTFPKVNMGFINSQSTRSSCEITSVKS